MKKKIACIERLLEIGLYDEFIHWLTDSSLVKEVQKDLLSNYARAEYIYSILEKNAKDNKIILLDYDWVVLPVEIIKITCVTDREKKEFCNR
jgi:hypothetical protein